MLKKFINIYTTILQLINLKENTKVILKIADVG